MPFRMIKDTLRTSRNVNSLSDFQFRVWVHLITYVDDFGRGSADPELLKGLLFPRRHGVTVKQINDAIGTLASKGMVTLYDYDGEPYFYFPKWGEHQRIRSKVSKFPEPPTDDGEFPQSAASGGEPPQNAPVNLNLNLNQKPKPETYKPKPEPDTCARAREEADLPNSDSDRWEEFWNAYPRKSGGDIRQACREYLAAIDHGVDPGILISAAEALAQRTPPETFRYLPSAEKWLRNKGWLENPEGSQGTATNNIFLKMYEEEYGGESQ